MTPTTALGRGDGVQGQSTVRKTPSIYDVARQARVSHQTVSRVINRGGGVAPETRRRVQAVIDDLGFVANRAARNMRRASDIGVVVVGEPDAASWAALRRLNSHARAAHAAVIVEMADADGLEEAVSRLLADGVAEAWRLDVGQLRRLPMRTAPQVNTSPPPAPALAAPTLHLEVSTAD